MMPTHSAQNLNYRITPPDYISVEGVTVVSGMTVTNTLNNITSEQTKNPQKIEVANIPGYGTAVVRWIVRGKGPVKITVTSVKGGTAETSNIL
jgi:hypothetical protein